MTFIKNKIVSLKGQTIIDGMFILEEGKPIDSYYMLDATVFSNLRRKSRIVRIKPRLLNRDI